VIGHTITGEQRKIVHVDLNCHYVALNLSFVTKAPTWPSGRLGGNFATIVNCRALLLPGRLQHPGDWKLALGKTLSCVPKKIIN